MSETITKCIACYHLAPGHETWCPVVIISERTTEADVVQEARTLVRFFRNTADNSHRFVRQLDRLAVTVERCQPAAPTTLQIEDMTVRDLSVDSFGVVRFVWDRGEGDIEPIQVAPPDVDDENSRMIVIWRKQGVVPIVQVWLQSDSSRRARVIRGVLATIEARKGV